MSIESDLNRAVIDHARRRHQSAGRRMEFTVRSTAPEDTGRLSQGVRVGPTKSTGSVLTAEITSNALSDEGFDYPLALNVMRRIAPTRRKYLRWYGRDGRPIFSKGFTNRHKAWWDKSVTAKNWTSALKAGG